MKNHWHEQIQRYVNGQSSAEEAAALQAALHDDAELRAWYLDYMNLDVALGAAAELAGSAGSAEDKTTRFSPASAPVPAPASPHYGRWLAAMAACAAVVLLAVLPRQRSATPARPNIATPLSSTESRIARLSLEPASPFPAWMSPTGSLLDAP